VRLVTLRHPQEQASQAQREEGYRDQCNGGEDAAALVAQARFGHRSTIAGVPVPLRMPLTKDPEETMGDDVEARTFSRADRTRYRQKVRHSLDVFARMLRESRFDTERQTIGCEIELNLVDEHGDPVMRNEEVLAAIAHPDFQTELGQFNVEINIPPRPLSGTSLAAFEDQVRAVLNGADQAARGIGAHLMMIGILPTLQQVHLQAETLTTNPRYRLLNEQIFAARGEDMSLEIDGPERLRATAESIAPEAACTSVQLHLQVAPESFAAYWNAAQVIAGAQLAVGANSPYLFGKELWRETRIALFDQATDTRSEELKEQGVRPRVWFGERWITSIFDLFEENVRYFPALLPICDDEDPAEMLERGDPPRLSELRLHNGTVYRWNRPVYDVVQGEPHLRVENRVLPAGPTVADTAANAAFYYGLVRVLADDERPLWTRLSFGAADENFHAAARRGIDALLFWPGVGEVPAAELVLRRLLPLADEGLQRWGVDPSVRERLLGIIEARCLTGQNGASWQVATVHQLQEQRNLARPDALRVMALRYAEHMHSNEPVHTWPVEG
jgi:Glutamate-cysteine ligase family 2(GCS2)